VTHALAPGQPRPFRFRPGYAVADRFRPKPFRIWLTCGPWPGYWPGSIEPMVRQ